MELEKSSLFGTESRGFHVEIRWTHVIDEFSTSRFSQGSCVGAWGMGRTGPRTAPLDWDWRLRPTATADSDEYFCPALCRRPNQLNAMAAKHICGLDRLEIEEAVVCRLSSTAHLAGQGGAQ